MDIIWGVVLFAVTILVGSGWELMRRHQYSGARLCFWFGAIILTGWDMMWITQTDSPLPLRIAVSAMVGAFALVGLSEMLRWATHEAKSQPSGGPPPMSSNPPTPPSSPAGGNDAPVTQGSGTIYNAPGGTIYAAPPPTAAPQRDPESAYQAGVTVAKVFGGRRSPTDATTYEFVELKNANQLNAGMPFEYDGMLLVIQSVRTRVGLDISRPQDGMVYGGVVAKVVGAAPR